MPQLRGLGLQRIRLERLVSLQMKMGVALNLAYTSSNLAISTGLSKILEVYSDECIPQDYLASQDQWVYNYVGKYFSYKNMAADEDAAFVSQRPTNVFKIIGVCLYHDNNPSSAH